MIGEPHPDPSCQTLERPLIAWHTPLRAAVLRSGEGMTAGEQMFFLGAPLAHVLAYESHLRARRTLEARGAARLTRVVLRRA